tara:strand:+ start:153 stop:422 length:270 start_codon:yes stop_codon:yes gene_type:complete
MEKFIVFGKYCDDVIVKRKVFRTEHLERLKILQEKNILITLGPTKCTKYFFGIFKANFKNDVENLIERDIYWKKGIWITYDVYPWVQAL